MRVETAKQVLALARSGQDDEQILEAVVKPVRISIMSMLPSMPADSLLDDHSELFDRPAATGVAMPSHCRASAALTVPCTSSSTQYRHDSPPNKTNDSARWPEETTPVVASSAIIRSRDTASAGPQAATPLDPTLTASVDPAGTSDRLAPPSNKRKSEHHSQVSAVGR